MSLAAAVLRDRLVLPCPRSMARRRRWRRARRYRRMRATAGCGEDGMGGPSGDVVTAGERAHPTRRSDPQKARPGGGMHGPTTLRPAARTGSVGPLAAASAGRRRSLAWRGKPAIRKARPRREWTSEPSPSRPVAPPRLLDGDLTAPRSASQALPARRTGRGTGPGASTWPARSTARDAATHRPAAAVPLRRGRARGGDDAAWLRPAPHAPARTRPATGTRLARIALRRGRSGGWRRR